MEFLAMDGSVIKVHQHAAGAAKKIDKSNQQPVPEETNQRWLWHAIDHATG